MLTKQNDEERVFVMTALLAAAAAAAHFKAEQPTDRPTDRLAADILSHF